MGLLWIGAGILGALALRKVFATPAASQTMSTKKIEKLLTIMGRTTYLHAPEGATRVLVFFHGFSNTAASRGPKLAAALGDQKIALVVPQLGSKSEPGDLATNFARYLELVRGELELPASPLLGIAHSGGYTALAAALRQSSFNAAGMLDAFYGQYDTYHDYVLTGRCLIDIYRPGTETAPLSERLATALAGRGGLRYQIEQTTTLHDSIPEKYIADMASAFDACSRVPVG